MKPTARVPAGLLEKKPAHGQPCNRCGLCCMAVPCAVSKKVFGIDSGRCPALEGRPMESWCGLVGRPEKYAPAVVAKHGASATSQAALLLIGAGFGCDARFNGERPNQRFYEELRMIDILTKDEVLAARRLWGI